MMIIIKIKNVNKAFNFILDEKLKLDYELCTKSKIILIITNN